MQLVTLRQLVTLHHGQGTQTVDARTQVGAGSDTTFFQLGLPTPLNSIKLISHGQNQKLIWS